MKKFTKGCLITALILFIIGAVFCATFGMMGGFRQIDSVSRKRFGDLRFMFGDVIWYYDDWYEDWDEERWSEMKSISNSTTTSGEQTDYSVNDISDIYIQLGGENLVIEESEDDYIWISNNSGYNRVKYGVNGTTFKLYSTKRVRFWKNISRGKIYLYLPKGLNLDSIDLEMGAGRLESITLDSDEINMEIGAAECSIAGISGRDISIDIGAGKANIDSISADDANISVGAGSISIKGLDVKDISLEVGMGNIDVVGRISKDADVDCGMGSINMELQGNESDHNYYLDCAMGSISIGSSKYSGLASEKTIDNGSSSDFNVECAMGNINIDFE
ncbi:MAG: DUF4097 family beta strand repeat protein [Lachnospiraceae bacterium]|nr:DUF4097 family beta strand repeat protein [Lachnospiraceae bacterium]